MNEKLAYSINEVAEQISLSRSQVKELVYAKKIKSLKVGRRRIVPRWAVEEFFNSAGGPATGPDADWDKMLEGV